jgi:AcrR family transcriptional regulator
MLGRPAKTREALLSAGLALLIDRPIDAIPIDDVVAHAGVAKGSFFNHFSDKQAFADAITNEMRTRLEVAVGKANAAVTNPLERMSRGMLIAVEFTLTERKRATVMVRSAWRTTLRGHVLNRGVVADINAAIEAKLVRPEAVGTGMTFWIGVCQALSRTIIERNLSRGVAAEQTYNMQVLGFSGLGAKPARVSSMANSARRAVIEATLVPFIRP